jgi:hypothetical protein
LFKYIKYLFSDKKAKIYWSVYYTVLIALLIPVVIFGNFLFVLREMSVFNIFTNVFLYFSFILFYSYSYYFYRLQEKVLSLYPQGTSKEILVEITEESYNIRTIANHDITINPRKKVQRFKFLKLDKQYILLGQIYHFGIFRQHIRPLTFTVEKNSTAKSPPHCKIIANELIEIKDNKLVIKNRKSSYGIMSIEIAHWKEL